MGVRKLKIHASAKPDQQLCILLETRANEGSGACVDFILPGHRVFADSSLFWPLASRKCSAFECCARASKCLHSKVMIELAAQSEVSLGIVAGGLSAHPCHAACHAACPSHLTETWEVSDDHGAGSALAVLNGWGVVATGPASLNVDCVAIQACLRRIQARPRGHWGRQSSTTTSLHVQTHTDTRRNVYSSIVYIFVCKWSRPFIHQLVAVANWSVSSFEDDWLKMQKLVCEKWNWVGDEQKIERLNKTKPVNKRGEGGRRRERRRRGGFWGKAPRGPRALHEEREEEWVKTKHVPTSRQADQL